jgi:hypothetical protein
LLSLWQASPRIAVDDHGLAARFHGLAAMALTLIYLNLNGALTDLAPAPAGPAIVLVL